MNSSQDRIYYTLENAWQVTTPEQESDVLNFWKDNGLSIDQLKLRQRTKQVVIIARDLERRVIGVCTAYKQFVHRLNNHVYVYRTLINSGSRYLGIGMDLLVTSRDFFNNRFKEKTDTDCIGLMFALENQEIANAFKQAVWPRTGFIFLGNDNQGQQIRIFYFDDAMI